MRREEFFIKISHLNIRSLKNKVQEVKQITATVKPHLFGLSECELKNNTETFDINKLKVPGYKLELPKSWEAHGYARVVVYVKNGLIYERVHELEDDHVQSIWIKTGFKNTKPFYVANIYREHSSELGNSVAAQHQKLQLLINQFEAAIEHQISSDQNEIHILGDINLDSLKWHLDDYNLKPLARMIINFCNVKFIRLIRTIHNSIINKLLNWIIFLTFIISRIDNCFRFF